MPPAFWVVLLGISSMLLVLARQLRLKWWPAFLSRLFLIMLILFVAISLFQIPRLDKLPAREILLVDQSSSIAESDRQAYRELASAWKTISTNRIVVSFGGEAAAIMDQEWPLINSDSSDIHEALTLAENLLGENPGRVILLSDGIADSKKDILGLVSHLESLGHVLDVFPVQPLSYSNDFYLGEISLPKGLWENTSYRFQLPLVAPNDGEVLIQLVENNVSRGEQSVQVKEGLNHIPIDVTTGGRGIHTIKIIATWENDPFVDNNMIYASAEVYQNPRVMLVTTDIAAANPFRNALLNQGVQVDYFSPEDIPINIERLGAYQVIVVHNILADRFSLEQMKTLEVFVSQTGGGLVFIGGQNSFSLGGYQNTPLNKIMPITLTPSNRSQSAPITFVMVLDKSGSMLGRASDPVSPIDLTKEAAMRAVESLRAEDYVGVLTFSGTPQWDVEIRRLGDGINLRLAQDAISQIGVGGGTLMYQALEEAVQTLIEQRPTDPVHIVLMSDGKSGDGSPVDFRLLAKQALDQNITISTIAFSESSDVDLLQKISEWGGGRFYEVYDPEGLPRIMVAESIAAHSEHVQKGNTGFVAGEESHPILSGFSLGDLPQLDGYHSITSKSEQGAEDILLSANFQDPILSSRQVGLGRVITWMSDLGEDWAGDWQGWRRQGEFWLNVLRYALPDPVLDPAQVEIDFEGKEISISLDLLSTVGLPINLANPEFIYVDENDQVISYPLRQIGPGQYQASMPVPSDGAYRSVVRYANQGEVNEIAAPFVVNYPIEWQPGNAELGHQNLVNWAQITGGQQIDLYQEIAESLSDTDESSEVDFLTVLLISVVVLWPIEIAIRRRWMPWQ